uniref:Exosome component 1 n=1 Tax=Nothoprocta perdicaria TaxID=30464 RepID=A0A8C6ZIN3_NOTPE
QSNMWDTSRPGSRLCTRRPPCPSSAASASPSSRPRAPQLPVVSVQREAEAQLLPDVGAVVTCKVCSINSRFAKVHILYVGSTPLKACTGPGLTRSHPLGAFPLTRVPQISLGDAQSNYLLSTAENELGVVVARSEAGVQMVPISWCEMQCPRTHTKDFRKVARVQPQFLQT